ncbi:hypothetical protein [Arthrobacter woluwensis]
MPRSRAPRQGHATEQRAGGQQRRRQPVLVLVRRRNLAGRPGRLPE